MGLKPPHQDQGSHFSSRAKSHSEGIPAEDIVALDCEPHVCEQLRHPSTGLPLKRQDVGLFVMTAKIKGIRPPLLYSPPSWRKGENLDFDAHPSSKYSHTSQVLGFPQRRLSTVSRSGELFGDTRPYCTKSTSNTLDIFAQHWNHVTICVFVTNRMS